MRNYSDCEKEINNLISKEIQDWAFSEIQAEVRKNGDDCDDNYRIAEIGNHDHEKIFAEIEGMGCCGFHNFEVLGPDGKTYILGYNHGH